jgi:hypothetical protein
MEYIGRISRGHIRVPSKVASKKTSSFAAVRRKHMEFRTGGFTAALFFIQKWNRMAKNLLLWEKF